MTKGKILLLVVCIISCVNLFGQTKLDLMTKKCAKSAELEMIKTENQEEIKQNSGTGTIKTDWRIIPSDCKIVINNVEPNEKNYIITGQYVYKVDVYTDGKFLLTTQKTKFFTAKSKEVLDDFVITEFTSLESK